MIFSHAGGTTPYLIERFEFQARSGPYQAMPPQGVHPTIEHFLYDTAHCISREALGTLMGLVLVSQILFATD